jgi:4-carboxymuconolactone decarboxylase
MFADAMASQPRTTSAARVHEEYGLVLAAVVFTAHLVVHGVHTFAHLALALVLPTGLTVGTLLFVYALPALGIGLLFVGPRRTGVAVFSGALAASLLLGVTLHFLVQNPDHVSSVPPGPWAGPFRATAIAAAVVDGLGTLTGIWLWRTGRGREAEMTSTSGRVEGVPDTGFRPLTRVSYWLSRRLFGEVPKPLTVTAHHPRLFVGYNAFEAALEGADAVEDRLTELAVLKAATDVGCEFCVDLGAAEASDLGVSDAQLRHLADFEDSDAFSERERLVLRYAEALSSTPPLVTDTLFDALSREFDETELVELTAAIAFENYRARFNRAFDIGAQGFSEGSCCPGPPGVTGGEDDILDSGS